MVGWLRLPYWVGTIPYSTGYGGIEVGRQISKSKHIGGQREREKERGRKQEEGKFASTKFRISFRDPKICIPYLKVHAVRYNLPNFM